MIKLKAFLSFCCLNYLLLANSVQAQEVARNPFVALPPPNYIAANPLLPSASAPLNSTVKLYTLSYATAEDIAPSLKELFLGKLSVAKTTNSLILQGS